MIYFESFGDRLIPAKLEHTFFVGLSKEQAVCCRLLYMLCGWFLFLLSFLQIQSEAAVFREHGVLKLEDKVYFTLHEDVNRDAFVGGMIPFRVVFTAIGVATFWPDR